MSADRRRLDRESAERMLDAVAARPEPGRGRDAPVDDASAADPLARLLSAAAAPAADAELAGELAGEEAAVAAFAAARSAPGAPVRPRRAGFPLASLLSAKLSAAVLVLTTAGGIALASATDTLPILGDPENAPSASPTDGSTSGKAGRAPSGDAGPRPSHGSPQAPESPTVRLCRAYVVAARSNPRAAGRNPAFTGLVRAAGGAEHVGGYCSRVIKDGDGPHAGPSPRKESPTPAPDRPGRVGPPEDDGPPGGDDPGGGNGGGKGNGKTKGRPDQQSDDVPDDPPGDEGDDRTRGHKPTVPRQGGLPDGDPARRDAPSRAPDRP
ncbi:hypothetical protein [Thermomonospora umbrina]|uniref:Uncharacterized protein n=1 Tax=Thermomonospora umbrina TaxID=111806 RepID=A0A3D9SSC5_9ACTN|nr:hypothetical protein [Thermomonospora umbrina]REE95524.1 hypothetical protein DFJ69_0914 [Thermomonospora umbrina]